MTPGQKLTTVMDHCNYVIDPTTLVTHRFNGVLPPELKDDVLCLYVIDGGFRELRNWGLTEFIPDADKCLTVTDGIYNKVKQ